MKFDPNQNHRILVIDDNKSIHEDFRKILGRKNTNDRLDAMETELFGEQPAQAAMPEFQIDSAFQGREGFGLIEKSLMENRPYAMAFVDVRMPPGWDGIETAAHIWRKYPDLQIVICTAYSDYSWEEMLQKLGYSDRLVILKKPFDTIEVLQLAVSMTEKWRLYNEAKQRLVHLEQKVHERTVELEKVNAELARASEMLKSATRNAQKMAEAALVSCKAKNEFFASMSHEIRTPMNGVLGIINLLLDTPLMPEQRELAKTIKFSADSLLAITNDILDFSKIEAGKLCLEKTDFDLRDTVKRCVELFRPSADEKGLVLDCSLPADVPDKLVGDPARLRQVLLNLLGNAIKFTERGGVDLEIALMDTRDDEVVLHFSVRDTGIGIPEEVQQSLFDSFTQAESSTTRKYGGTGLGLTISRRLVDLMGGTMGVESTYGVGSIFWFSLPFAQQTQKAIPSTSPEVSVPSNGDASSGAGVGLAGLRVLVAEDNKINQVVAVKLLEKMGCVVDVAVNGLEAVEAWQRDRHEVVLMDCSMPKMDGFSACRRIRELESEHRCPRTPIIAVTASVMPEDKECCLSVGMDGFVTKPVDFSVLKQALETAVSEQIRRAPS